MCKSGRMETRLDLWRYRMFDPNDLRGSFLSVFTLPPSPSTWPSPPRMQGVFPKNVAGGSLCFPVDSVRSSWPGSDWRRLQHHFYGVSVLLDNFQTVIKVTCRAGVQTKIQSALKMTKRLYFNSKNWENAWSTMSYVKDTSSYNGSAH